MENKGYFAYNEILNNPQRSTAKETKQVSIFQKTFDKLAFFSKLLRQKFVSETSFAVLSNCFTDSNDALHMNISSVGTTTYHYFQPLKYRIAKSESANTHNFGSQNLLMRMPLNLNITSLFLNFLAHFVLLNQIQDILCIVDHAER